MHRGVQFYYCANSLNNSGGTGLWNKIHYTKDHNPNAAVKQIRSIRQSGGYSNRGRGNNNNRSNRYNQRSSKNANQSPSNQSPLQNTNNVSPQTSFNPDQLQQIAAFIENMKNKEKK